MPDLTVSFLRQRPTARSGATFRSSGPIPSAITGVALLLIALGISGCDRGEPEAVSSEETNPSEQTPGDNPLESDTGAALVDEPEKSDAPEVPIVQTDDGAPVEGALFDGRLAELTRETQAGDLVHLHVGETHLLLVGAETGRRESTVTTWLLPRGVHEQPLAAMDRVTTTHRVDPAIGPRVVPTANGGALLLRATDSIAADNGAASFVTRTIGADGNIEEIAIPLVIPGWVMRRGWSATQLGSEVLVCFLGTPGIAASAGPDNSLACGTLSEDGEQWTRPPVRVAEAPVGTSIDVPFVAGNGTHAIVTYFDPTPDVSRIVGRFVRLEGDQLAWDDPVDLTTEPIPAGTEVSYRRTPMLLATDEGALFALPAHGGIQSRAGSLTLDGQITGGIRVVAGLGSLFEHPRFVAGDQGSGLLFDSTGVRGERSLLAFSDEGAMLIDIVGVFGRETDLRSQARLGPTSGRAVTYVWEVPDLSPRVVIRENDRW